MCCRFALIAETVYDSTPVSKRVVGLKPGSNSKTIQTNTPPTPPLLPLPPSLSPPADGLTVFLKLFYHVTFFYSFKTTYRSGVRRRAGTPTPTSCGAPGFSLHMMLPFSSRASTRPMGVSEKRGKERTGLGLVEPEQGEGFLFHRAGQGG